MTDVWPAPTPYQHPVPEPLHGPTCQVCGAQPARAVTLRRVTGLVIIFSMQTTHHVLCRDCGVATARAAQSRTATTGWWGLFAAVANVGVLIANAVGLQRLRHLDPPHGGLRPPLEVGRPAFLRLGALVTAGVLVVLGALALRQAEPAPSLSVGTCVRGTAVVRCNAPHDGRVVAVADDEAQCPRTADSWLTRSGDDHAYCVDEVALATS